MYYHHVTLFFRLYQGPPEWVEKRFLSKRLERYLLWLGGQERETSVTRSEGGGHQVQEVWKVVSCRRTFRTREGLGDTMLRMRQFRPMITGWVALAISGAVLPSARAADAARDCLKWNISRWDAQARFSQSNGWQVYFDFNQNGSSLQGPARSFAGYRGSNPILRARGQVDGFVGLAQLLPTSPGFPRNTSRADAAISFTIRWDNGTVGVYDGRITNLGDASGTTWDLRHPQSKATWRHWQHGGARPTCS